jgi:hypothetical protein
VFGGLGSRTFAWAFGGYGSKAFDLNFLTALNSAGLEIYTYMEETADNSGEKSFNKIGT